LEENHPQGGKDKYIMKTYIYNIIICVFGIFFGSILFTACCHCPEIQTITVDKVRIDTVKVQVPMINDSGYGTYLDNPSTDHTLILPRTDTLPAWIGHLKDSVTVSYTPSTHLFQVHKPASTIDVLKPDTTHHITTIVKNEFHRLDMDYVYAGIILIIGIFIGVFIGKVFKV